MKATSKSVEVEYIQWTGDNLGEIKKFVGSDEITRVMINGELSIYGALPIDVNDYVLNIDGYIKTIDQESFHAKYDIEPKESEWISVDDSRLHDEMNQGNKILCYGNGYMFESEFDDGVWSNIGGEDFTHWMYRMTPPVTESK